MTALALRAAGRGGRCGDEAPGRGERSGDEAPGRGRGAAALSAAAGLVHLGLAPAHFGDWWMHGLLFVLAGVLQVALAAALLRRPGAAEALAGVALNLGIVLVYVVSRTNGLPGGAHAWRPEQAGLGDLSTTASELVLVAMLVGLLGPVAARRAFTALALVGVGLWVARATNVLL